MTNMKSKAITNAGWDVPFWFAVLSPVLGVIGGVLAFLLFYH